MAQKGTEIYYITGNHDEMLRRFADADLGHIHLRNRMVLTFGRAKIWIFHGDIFDASIQNARWLAKLGGWSYDLLIWVNRWLNMLLERMGREKYSLSKTIKDSVKKAVKYVSDFEFAAAEMTVTKDPVSTVCVSSPHIKTYDEKTLSTIPIDSACFFWTKKYRKCIDHKNQCCSRTGYGTRISYRR